MQRYNKLSNNGQFTILISVNNNLIYVSFMNFNKLEQLIKDSPLRKSDIIAQSGISKATLDNVLKGMDAKVSTIESIARVLGVSPAVFF